MFVLINKANGIYFYRIKDKKPQIFTFNTPEIAGKCLELFQTYSVQRMMEEGNPFGVPKVLSVISAFELEELTDKNKFENTIPFENIMEEKGIRF